MPVYRCPVATCNYTTGDQDEAMASALLVLHNHQHAADNHNDVTHYDVKNNDVMNNDVSLPVSSLQPSTNRASLALLDVDHVELPKVGRGCSEDIWEGFLTRWDMFCWHSAVESGTPLSYAQRIKYLFQCCDRKMQAMLLNEQPAIRVCSEEELLEAIHKVAVIPVRKARIKDLHSLIAKQNEEPSREMAVPAKTSGKSTPADQDDILKDRKESMELDLEDDRMYKEQASFIGEYGDESPCYE